MDQDTIAAITEVTRAFGIAESNEKSAAVFGDLLQRLRGAVSSPGPTSFDAVMETLAQIEVELQVGLPNCSMLLELNTELQRLMAARLTQAAKDISQAGKTDIFGAEANEQTTKLQMSAERIGRISAKKVAQINALTALILANQKAGGSAPPEPPIDNDTASVDDGNMDQRLDKLESISEKTLAQLAALQESVAVIRSNYSSKEDVAGVKGDVGVIKSNYATREDVASIKTEIASGRSLYATKEDIASIKVDINSGRSLYSTKEDVATLKAEIVSARAVYATKEDLQKEMGVLTWKLIGTLVALVAAVYFIARPPSATTSHQSSPQAQTQTAPAAQPATKP